MKARDVMEVNYEVVRSDMTVGEVGRFLGETNLSGVPVVDQDGKVVGMVTEEDIIQASLTTYFDLFEGENLTVEEEHFGERFKELSGEKVTKIISPHVAKVHADTPLEKVVILMISKHVRSVPVVGSDGKIIGVVTRQRIIDLIVGS